jgi:hypothetical protein
MCIGRLLCNMQLEMEAAAELEIFTSQVGGCHC